MGIVKLHECFSQINTAIKGSIKKMYLILSSNISHFFFGESNINQPSKRKKIQTMTGRTYLSVNFETTPNTEIQNVYTITMNEKYS